MAEVKKIKLGIIGMSEGNGHPYSWSAIFNGYNREKMQKCSFPIIPEYLSKQVFPEDYLFDKATVSHIWTQDKNTSNMIASASLIPNICDTLEEMIPFVDGVLLARDDAENHAKYAVPFLEAGLPIYIDKPFALSMDEANYLWSKSKYHNQIFSCSALQFAKEFKPESINKNKIGETKFIWGTIPKCWKKYGVHLIEPLLNLIPERGNLISVESLQNKISSVTQNVYIKWSSGIEAIIQTSGNVPTPLFLRVQGSKDYQDLYFSDSFYAFRSALIKFINIIEGKELNISRSFTKEMVEILEKGSNE